MARKCTATSTTTIAELDLDNLDAVAGSMAGVAYRGSDGSAFIQLPGARRGQLGRQLPLGVVVITYPDGRTETLNRDYDLVVMEYQQKGYVVTGDLPTPPAATPAAKP